MLERNPKKVKIVFKHFPLKTHQFAYNAAAAAVVAQGMGKFWEFHDKLFENYNQMSNEKIVQIASELGLNMDVFRKTLDSEPVKSAIERDVRDALEAGVRGTPTVFINGMLITDKSVDGLQKAIDEELERSGKK